MSKETAPFIRKAQSLIKQINKDLSNMKLTSSEVLQYKFKPDPNLSEAQQKKRQPDSTSMFSDAKILLRRGIAKLKGKPSSSDLVKQRTTLFNHLNKIKEFEQSKEFMRK
jgi:3-phenylpropionate/cinnamic acid dioxygenase small subunit